MFSILSSRIHGQSLYFLQVLLPRSTASRYGQANQQKHMQVYWGTEVSFCGYTMRSHSYEGFFVRNDGLPPLAPHDTNVEARVTTWFQKCKFSIIVQNRITVYNDASCNRANRLATPRVRSTLLNSNPYMQITYESLLKLSDAHLIDPTLNHDDQTVRFPRTLALASR